jgi:hypothetical protein
MAKRLSELKESDIYAIRNSHKIRSEIAAIFNISQSHASDIIAGRSWAHLESSHR